MSDATRSAAEMNIPTRIAGMFIDSKLTPLVVLGSILLGWMSITALPREEEPQIVVPMIDISVMMPGASPVEVEQRVTRPLERSIREIPGVEYVYSTSREELSFLVVRFTVGHDETEAIVALEAKLASRRDHMPPGAMPPLVQVRSIDDVPILALTLSSATLDAPSLRRIAVQVADILQSVEDASETRVIGGTPRCLRVVPDLDALAARGLSLLDLVGAIRRRNLEQGAGSTLRLDPAAGKGLTVSVEAGRFLDSREAVEDVVVGVHRGAVVLVREVADVVDGPIESEAHVLHRPAMESGPGDRFRPAVTIALSKRRGANATAVADEALERVHAIRGTILPRGVDLRVTRNYGKTAEEKSNELLWHMLLAVISVTLLIAGMLGRRESGVVAVAIPVTLALTLASFSMLGFTLNRITLFALIFSIGILVDDPIVDVENIVRHLRFPESRGRPVTAVVLEAVSEVRSPLILATLTVIAAILPMAFVGGLMGPYMRPIPVGASLAMLFSMLVAFVVTPWAAARFLGSGDIPHVAGEEAEDRVTRLYRRVMGAILHVPWKRRAFLTALTVLLLAALATVPLGWVQVKMLPFDDKDEFQVIVDMPEGSSLEETLDVARRLADVAALHPAVEDVQVYAGTASPHNFNGLVRHYFLRRGENVADLQVNLRGGDHRSEQSHTIARSVREALQPVANEHRARIKVAEVPPGPPVLQTLVAEVYGPSRERREALARRIETLFRETPGVVDVDTSLEDPSMRDIVEVDGKKAALAGIEESAVLLSLETALRGGSGGILHLPRELEDVPIVIRPLRADRSIPDGLERIPVRSPAGHTMPLSELVRVRHVPVETPIDHKNLRPVTYVMADVAGRTESPVYALLALRDRVAALDGAIELRYATLPDDAERYAVKWDGEIHVTYEVFRDLGFAFAVVLILIYLLVVGWFESLRTPLIIMAAIPFSLVGILPAHFLMGSFFSATSMIGFIAGAGIVVRNSIILVDFIELRLRQGWALEEAVVDAGAVRFRPMMLTAAAVVVGASVILFDPIFQGLALSLMAGEVASLLLSRMAVPVLYFIATRER